MPLKRRRTPAQAAASRTNGALGGRPARLDARSALPIEQARALGRSRLGRCARFWVDLVEGSVPGATIMDRIAASRELADRCGLPKRTESELIERTFTPILVQVEGGLGWPAPCEPAVKEGDDGQ